MTADRPKAARALLAEFELPCPGVLRMVLTDSAKGILDVVDGNPATPGAYGCFLGAIDATGQSLPLQIVCQFEHVEGRATARKTRIKAVIASALAIGTVGAS